MADGMTMDLAPLQGLFRELRTTLPQQLQARIVRGAVATGASVIRKAAISLAPIASPEDLSDEQRATHPPGTLKKAIYQVRLADASTPTLEVWKVDVRKGSRTTKKGNRLASAFYAGWVEHGHWSRPASGKGTKAGRIKRRGDRAINALAAGARWVPARPYMRPAFEANKAAAVAAMKAYLEHNISAGKLALEYLKVGGL
jgi:hypothetical protein